MPDELETAYKEGEWAYRAGKSLDDCPYDTELHGHHAIRWCLGWMDCDKVAAELDAAADKIGNPSREHQDHHATRITADY